MVSIIEVIQCRPASTVSMLKQAEFSSGMTCYSFTLSTSSPGIFGNSYQVAKSRYSKSRKEYRMKNRPNVRILFGIVLIAFLVTLGRGQETSYPTRIGLSASLQGNEFDILLPIRSEHVEIAPAFGMLWAEDGGSDIHLGVVPRFFLHRDKVAPFIGGRVALLIAS